MRKELRAIKALLPLLKLYPLAVPVIITLGIISSFAEGFGISLFIPLLQSFDPTTSNSAQNTNVLLQFFDSVFGGLSPNDRLPLISLTIFCCICLKALIAYANLSIFGWFNSQISHHLRSGIFKQLLTVNYSFLETSESGKLMNILTTETWQTSRALSVFISLITSICTISVLIALLFLLSWKLTLLAAIAMILISMVIQFVTRNVEQLGKQAVEVNKLLANRMWEGFSGMKVIRAFGRDRYEQERFDQASEQVRQTFFRFEMLSGSVTPLSEILSAALLIGILILFLSQSYANLPAFLTFVFVLYRLQPQVKYFDSSRIGLIGSTHSVEEVMALLDPSDKPYIHSGIVPFSQLRKGIALESIDFYYPNQSTPALQDISLYIPRGKTTALVGPSGAGKSTLIGLICRFYDPTSGWVNVDDCPLPQLSLTDWRNHMAIVSQDIYMFNTTVRENIVYGRLDATDDEVIAAAQLANAHEFIQQLPYGYETQVGDRGVRLSGGQRQRIALARAIIRDPEILILDEATNALDSLAETLIQEALETLSQNRTVIVIAHRLSTIEQADQIIVLREGRVVEQGTVPHLLELNGLFAELHRLQYRTTQR
jgi:subfamily B ATP-binding cassette protein MsbA